MGLTESLGYKVCGKVDFVIHHGVNCNPCGKCTLPHVVSSDSVAVQQH